MTRVCTVCAHPDRRELDRALVRREPYRAIACRYAVGRESLRRHAEEHLPELLVKAHDAELVADADALLSRVRGMIERLETWIDRAERSYDYKEVRAFAGEWRQQIELLAKLAGQLAQQGATTIINNPQYIEVRALIVEALEPFPDAREAVVRALEAGGNGRG